MFDSFLNSILTFGHSVIFRHSVIFGHSVYSNKLITSHKHEHLHKTLWLCWKLNKIIMQNKTQLFDFGYHFIADLELKTLLLQNWLTEFDFDEDLRDGGI